MDAMETSKLLCPIYSRADLKGPFTHFKYRGDCSYQAVALKRWNDLPLSTRLLDSVEAFKSKLKTFFNEAF